MRISLGLSLNRRRAGVFGPINLIIPEITGTPRVGQTLTLASNGTWSGVGTVSYARQWYRNTTPIAGATGTTYTLVAADDQTIVSCRVFATDDVGTRIASSNGLAVTYNAPVAAKSLANQTFTEGTGVQTYDASGDFTGSALVYSVNSIPGVTINSSTGVVSFDTGTMAVQAGTSVIVTATNSGGSDNSGFSLTIQVSGSPTTTELSHGGATFTLEGVASHGTFDDGSLWVVPTGASVTLLEALPAFQIAPSRDVNPVEANVPLNGAMINPGNAARRMTTDSSTLALRQVGNHGAGQNPRQGWDGADNGTNWIQYDATLNEDPIAKGGPVTLSPGDTFAKAVSLANPGSARPINGMGLLTVLASAPSAGAIRPGLAGTATTATANRSDIDIALVPDVAYPGGVPTLSYADAMGFFNLLKTEVGTYNVSHENGFVGNFSVSQNPWSLAQTSTYDGDYYEMLLAMVLACSTDMWTETQKRDILARAYGHALDLAARVDQGGLYIPNGGHAQGEGALIAVMARLTGNSALSTAAALTTQTIVQTGNALSNRMPAGISVFGDYAQLFYVNQTDIDRSISLGSARPYTQDMLNWPTWNSDGRRIRWFDDQIAQKTHPGSNDLGNDTTYVDIAGTVIVTGAACVHMYGADAFVQDEVYLDYADRLKGWFDAPASDGVVVVTTERRPLGTHSVHALTNALWTTEVASRRTHPVWTPPGTGTPPDVAIVLTEMPFDGYVFDTNGATSGVALIRGTGTPGAIVQARGTSAGGDLAWTQGTVAGNGSFEIAVPVPDETAMGRWYVPEARYGTDDLTKQTGTNTFSCGDVVAFLGQSELVYFLNPASFYTTGFTQTLDADNLTLVLDDTNGGTGATIYTRKITTATATQANPGSLALANLLNHVKPGRKLMLVDLAEAGTSPTALASDTSTSRNWSALSAIVGQVRAGGSDIGAVVLNWYNAPAATIAQMHQNWAPFLFGQYWDGTTFPLGANHNGPQWTGPVEYCLYDLDATSDSMGRGIFIRDKTTLYLMQPMPFFNSDDVEDLGFTGGNRMKDAQRLGVLNLAASSQFQQVGVLMPSTHVVEFGDSQGAIHPQDGGDPYGIPQFALLHAPAMLAQAGVTVGEPILTNAVVVNSTTIDMVVNLPNGGTLTTIRALNSIAAPDPEPPHYQAVVGFEINTAGAHRPIYKTTETSYPITHRGTVTITNSGTGTAPNRTGTVRIVLEDPVADGDFITYLRGQANAALAIPRDTIANLFLNMLIEHVPAWYDATADYPFLGVPVRPQTATPAFSGVTGATVPGQFQTSDWSVVDAVSGGTLTVTVSAVPANGGSAITAIQYQVNGGVWTASGLTAAGSFNITGLTDGQSQIVALRAVNAIGPGVASDTKSATPSAAPPTGIFLVGRKTASWNAGSTATVSLTDLTGGVASAPAEGDLVVVWGAMSANTNRSMAIGTSGYAGTGSLFVNDTNDVNAVFGYKVMTSTPDTDVAITHTTSSSDAATVNIMVFRNVDPTTPMDVTLVTAQDVNGAVPDPGAITPTTSGALLVIAGANCHAAATEQTMSASYLSNAQHVVRKGTTRYVNSLMGTVEWASGAYDPAAFTFAHTTASDTWVAVTAALRPA